MKRIACRSVLSILLLCAVNCGSDEAAQTADLLAGDEHELSSPFVGLDQSSYVGDVLESLYGTCQDDSYGGDTCHYTMRDLYCEFRMPIIYRGFRYSQTQATQLCREEIPPFYPDIVECLNDADTFVLCLADRHWKPEATDLFDVDRWLPPALALPVVWHNRAQSLNFFLYRGYVPFIGIQYFGAVTRISPPAMHIKQKVWGGIPRGEFIIYGEGTSRRFAPDQILIPCFGAFAVYTLPPGPTYFEGPFFMPLDFLPQRLD